MGEGILAAAIAAHFGAPPLAIAVVGLLVMIAARRVEQLYNAPWP